MASLSARERAKLPASAFAYVDSAGRRRLPIHDEAHVRNALARFNRIEFEDDVARDRARSRLLRAAKRHGIVPVGFIDRQLRPRLPSGAVTLLFADIVDSTGLVEALGDTYGPVLTAVRRTERSAIRRHGGVEVDARADEFFAVFTEAAAAVRAAIEIQEAVASATWPGRRRVRLRIGLHAGRPTPTAGAYVGIAVSTGARICALAGGGQVVLSRAVLAAIGETMPTDGLRTLGSHRLRGVAEAVELFEARPAG